MAAATASATATTTHRPLLQTMTPITTVVSIMTLRMLILAFWWDKPFNIVKLLEEERKSNSQILKKDSNSDSNMRARRRLNFAETSKCTVNASMVTLALMPMEPNNSRRRHISQATS